MNKYENAVFITITEDEGLYNYFRDIWKIDNNHFVNLVLAIENYFYEFVNHIPYLYQELVTTILDNDVIDFWTVAENLVDLF